MERQATLSSFHSFIPLYELSCSARMSADSVDASLGVPGVQTPGPWARLGSEITRPEEDSGGQWRRRMMPRVRSSRVRSFLGPGSSLILPRTLRSQVFQVWRQIGTVPVFPLPQAARAQYRNKLYPEEWDPACLHHVSRTLLHSPALLQYDCSKLPAWSCRKSTRWVNLILALLHSDAVKHLDPAESPIAWACVILVWNWLHSFKMQKYSPSPLRNASKGNQTRAPIARSPRCVSAETAA